MKSLADIIKNEADRCVKCGLCLPFCPTYVKTQHEGESPRGRIALLRGLAEGQLDPTESTQTYINHCVSCRACEVVCPAKVEYGKLFVHGQEFMRKARRHSLLKKFILFTLPRLSYFRKKYAGNRTEIKNMSIALIPGCIHTFFEKQIFTDVIKILNYLNISYNILNNFKCCGGLHQNSGDYKTSEKLKNQNKNLFEPYTTILSTATGCSAVLYEQFNTKIQDITVFLNQFDFKLKSLQNTQKILLHSPCTIKNILHQENMPEKLLQKIPNIEIMKLKHQYCCGASGTYFLEYPEMAEKLAGDILKEVINISPDMFITSNIGCAIYLKKLFKKYNISIDIQHPVNLLASLMR